MTNFKIYPKQVQLQNRPNQTKRALIILQTAPRSFLTKFSLFCNSVKRQAIIKVQGKFKLFCWTSFRNLKSTTAHMTSLRFSETASQVLTPKIIRAGTILRGIRRVTSQRKRRINFMFLRSILSREWITMRNRSIF